MDRDKEFSLSSESLGREESGPQGLQLPVVKPPTDLDLKSQRSSASDGGPFVKNISAIALAKHFNPDAQEAASFELDSKPQHIEGESVELLK